jgi:flagellar motor switch protein FliM
MADEDDLGDIDEAWGEALAEQGEGDGEDDDDLAAAWGAALEEQGVAGGDDMAAQWAAMIDDSEPELENATRGADRILNQEEIDNLLGFNIEDTIAADQSGIRALINSAMVSYERLPMLEIVFDRLVRLTTTSLRNFTSDNVEVSLDSISSVRFGDYLNSIPLPAILGVFKAEEWDGFGLCTVESSLIYSIIDVLLGGGRAACRPCAWRDAPTRRSRPISCAG